MIIKIIQIFYNYEMNDTNIKNTIAGNIRQYRAKYKISQEKLSEMTGISQQHISNIENEQVNPSIETLLAISNALNITVNDLVY